MSALSADERSAAYQKAIADGDAAVAAKKSDLAGLYFREAIALAESFASDDRCRYNALRRLTKAPGSYSEAETEPLYKQALEFCERNPTPDRGELKMVVSDYAHFLRMQRRLDEAKAMEARVNP